MSKMMWFTVGAAAGAYVAHRVHQTVRPYTPAGWVQTAERSVRDVLGFMADVREGMSEREAQLHGRLGLVDAGTPQVLGPEQGHGGGRRGGVGRGEEPWPTHAADGRPLRGPHAR